MYKIHMKYSGLILFLSVISMEYVKAQGCSDAGFCTVESIKTPAHDDTAGRYNNNIKTGVSFGAAKNGVAILTPYAEYTRNISRNISGTIRLLYSVHHGELATTSGFSDVLVSVNYRISPRINYVAGIKLPFNRSAISVSGQALPMAYQTSLGTIDGILGLGYSFSPFSITAAYQQPFDQNNNDFLAEEYPESSPEKEYLSTAGYERKGDVLLRASYTVKMRNEKYRLISSVLPVYHLGKDHYTDAEGITQKIKGSEGLTLNINMFLQYHPDNNSQVELLLGFPVISRESRPDGLQQFSVGLEFSQRF